MLLLKTVLKFLYLALVTTLILFLLLKIKHVLQEQKQYVSLPDYGKSIEFDPEREGGQMLPNLDQLMRSEKPSQAVRVVTNSKGFRNEKEFAYEHAERTFRILFMGDSYVDGMRTDQTKTIGYLLEKELNEKNRDSRFDRYEVMISSHNNPTNAWYCYQRHGYKYKPNLVLLGVTLGNDLTWNSYRVTFAPVKDARGKLSLEPTQETVRDTQKGQGLMIPEDAYVSKSLLDIFVKIERKIREFLAKRSALFGYETPPVLYPLASWPRHFFATDFSVSLGLFYSPLMPEMDTLYSDLEENLSGLNEEVARTGSRLVVVLFPVRIQLHGKDWDLLKKLYFLDEKKFDLEYPDKRLLAFCRKNNILCTDVLPAFQEISQKTPGSHLYRPRGDMHFSEKGQEAAAAKLYEFLRSL